MKFIFELIFAVVVIFFLWNVLKRMFFTAFYKFPKPGNDPKTTAERSKKNLDSRIHWDAETVDYEEVKENRETNQ